jgi:hypothetical protein
MVLQVGGESIQAVVFQSAWGARLAYRSPPNEHLVILDVLTGRVSW